MSDRADSPKMKLTCRYRVKNLEGELNRQARAVSFVWNYLNDVQRQALKWDRRWTVRWPYDRAGMCRRH